MKKYKLIKWYPSLGCKLSIGDTVEKTIGSCVYLHKGFTINPKEVENCPEFWEKVIEKDYEILSLYANSNIFNKVEGKKWKRVANVDEIYYDLKVGEPYGAAPLQIHSVRRLSDGEIFTIQDEVKTSLSDGLCIIYRFRLNNSGKLIVECTHSYLANKHNVDLFSDIQHIKKLLFKTEDGVDIYEGDKCYWADLHTFSWNRFNWDTLPQPQNHPKEKYKWFSTEQKAEEYILMNKPCLSINDVKSISTNVVQSNPFGLMGLIEDDLKEMVKSKL